MEARRRKASALWLRFSPVLGESATAPEPADGAFDNPPFGQNEESFGLIAPADDLNGEARHGVRQSVMKHRPGIGAVGKQLLEKRELSEQGGYNHDAAVAIPGRRRLRPRTSAPVTSACHSRPNVSTRTCRFLPLISLPPSKPCGSMRAPFSALLTLWLSEPAPWAFSPRT